MFDKKKEPKRFNVINDQTSNSFISAKVIQDAHTGVNYLLVISGVSIALTPLLDKDGKPLVTIPEKKEI